MDEEKKVDEIENETLGTKIKKNWKKIAAGTASVLAIGALMAFVAREFFCGTVDEPIDDEPTD